jgi:hypothetical protein
MSAGDLRVKTKSTMTLQKAVELGEYDPKFLATLPEWHTLSRHIQFQFIKTAAENRRKQLLSQFADLNNVLDYRLKPEIKEAAASVLERVKQVEYDLEKFLIEYSK